MRIGLFGGTFNPIHIGHLRAAQEVCEEFPLDACHLIPAAQPPHKGGETIASARDRLEMTRLAAGDDSLLKVSDIEVNRPGLSYTIDTVRHFKGAFPSGTELYLIMGLDAFLEIDTWKNTTDLLGAIAFIVMARADNGAAFGARQRLEDFLGRRLPDQYRWVETPGRYVHQGRPPIYFQDVPRLDISSSDIRWRLRTGRSIRHLVPGGVEDYIRTRGFYR